MAPSNRYGSFILPKNERVIKTNEGEKIQCNESTQQQKKSICIFFFFFPYSSFGLRVPPSQSDMSTGQFMGSLVNHAMESAYGEASRRYGYGMSNIQPNQWTPLNPLLMERYYDIFYHSWIVRTCFQEKVKAGLEGGFGYTWGSSEPKKRTKGGKREVRPETLGTSVTPDEIITDSPDMPWIKEVLEKAAMYHDIVGIIAFRKKVHPTTGVPRLEIIDLKKGYFIGKIDDQGNTEYGWVFHRNISALVPGSNRPAPGIESSTSGDGTLQPAPGTTVYAWPTLEPDVGSVAPFKSIMATIYVDLLALREMWQNELDGHFKITHPTWITKPVSRTRAPSEMNEFDMLLDVSGQLGPTESSEYFARSRMNAELSIHMSKNIQAMHSMNDDRRQRRIGLAPDYTETTVIRQHAWEDNHYIASVGTEISKGPEAKLRSDIVGISNMVAAQVAAVYGVPIPLFSGASGKTTGSKTTVGSRIEGSSFRGTLVRMRNRVATFFEEAYMMVIGTDENRRLSNILGHMGHGTESDEEVLVRHYVQNVLKPDGETLVDYAKKINAKRSARDNVVSVIDPELEKEMEGAEAEAEELRRRIEQRHLFTTPEQEIELERTNMDGSVKKPLGMDTPPEERSPFLISSTRKKLKNRKTRGQTPQEYSQSKPHEERSSHQPRIHKDMVPFKGPHIMDQTTSLYDKYELEIKDMLDEQQWLKKLEQARYQKMLEKESQEDFRISRIMVMGMQKFRVALNPDKLRAALRQAVQADPEIDNTHYLQTKQVEDAAVREIMKQRKRYVKGLLDDKRRIRIVWNSAPIPDFEMLATASKENLGIPPEMVGFIISKEMGVEDLREAFVQKEKLKDRDVATFLARNGLKIASKTTGLIRGAEQEQPHTTGKRKNDNHKDDTMEEEEEEEREETSKKEKPSRSKRRKVETGKKS